VWSRPLFEGVALIVAVAFASRPVIAKLRERSVQTPPPANRATTATDATPLQAG